MQRSYAWDGQLQDSRLTNQAASRLSLVTFALAIQFYIFAFNKDKTSNFAKVRVQLLTWLECWPRCQVTRAGGLPPASQPSSASSPCTAVSWPEAGDRRTVGGAARLSWCRIEVGESAVSNSH